MRDSDIEDQAKSASHDAADSVAEKAKAGDSRSELLQPSMLKLCVALALCILVALTPHHDNLSMRRASDLS